MEIQGNNKKVFVLVQAREDDDPDRMEVEINGLI